MSEKFMNFYYRSAGALLLMMATALLISSQPHGDLIQPHDPIFNLSLRYFFWIISTILLTAGLICLFLKSTLPRALLIAWLVTILAIYRIGYYWDGGHNLNGYLGSFSYAFGIPIKPADVLAEAVLIYLVFGSYAAILMVLLRKSPAKADELLKIHCESCGGKIQFALKNIGQTIPCPHCQKAIILRKPDNLKMSCFFCKEHIEFPAHALGEKIPCPHCNMDITLKEQA
jgi:DNA-directed RNA polymerase subunit RPC12/RpoP